MAWLLLPCLLAATSVAADAPPDAYRAEVTAFRQRREQSLMKEDGWLAVAGLFFLKPGANRVGSDPELEVALPPGSAPRRLGVFTLQGGRVSVRLDEPAGATINGQPAAAGELAPATDERPPDMLRVGTLSMHVHTSGGRVAIRLRDTQNPLRRDFKGLRWFEVDPDYRVSARLIRDAAPSKIEVVNTLGDVDEYTSEGVFEFALRGQTLRLRPMWSDGRLFFIFRDGTSGKETYPAARFLYADLAKDGTTLLDFNKAYNPPCAFNPYTTCPLPPKENRLKVRIEAGEKSYEGAHPSPPPGR